MSRPRHTSAIGAGGQHLRDAQEGEREEEAVEGGRGGHLDSFGLSGGIQMSHVLVTDHLNGDLTGPERMSCDAKNAPHV